jgi:pimeloyl-ACP methyl ester carboxylesterase
MTTWRSEFVTVDGASLHYLRAGQDKPPVIMLHGFTDSARNCEQFANELVDDYDVILVDERGHGLSSAATSDYSMADQARDMAGLIRALSLSKPAVIGHSIGAATATEMAIQFPDLMSLVILEDPPFRMDYDQGRDVDWAAGWIANLTAFKKRSHAEQLAEAMRDNAKWLPAENEAWVESKNQFDLSTFNTPLFANLIAWPRAEAITIPGLLIIGDPQFGAIVSSDVAQQVQAVWKNLEVVSIAGAGHSIRRDQPAPFAKIVKDYLRDHYSSL